MSRSLDKEGVVLPEPKATAGAVTRVSEAFLLSVLAEAKFRTGVSREAAAVELISQLPALNAGSANVVTAEDVRAAVNELWPAIQETHLISESNPVWRRILNWLTRLNRRKERLS